MLSKFKESVFVIRSLAIASSTLAPSGGPSPTRKEETTDHVSEVQKTRKKLEVS